MLPDLKGDLKATHFDAFITDNSGQSRFISDFCSLDQKKQFVDGLMVNINTNGIIQSHFLNLKMENTRNGIKIVFIIT